MRKWDDCIWWSNFDLVVNMAMRKTFNWYFTWVLARRVLHHWSHFDGTIQRPVAWGLTKFERKPCLGKICFSLHQTIHFSPTIGIRDATYQAVTFPRGRGISFCCLLIREYWYDCSRLWPLTFPPLPWLPDWLLARTSSNSFVFVSLQSLAFLGLLAFPRASFPPHHLVSIHLLHWSTNSFLQLAQ